MILWSLFGMVLNSISIYYGNYINLLGYFLSFFALIIFVYELIKVIKNKVS